MSSGFDMLPSHCVHFATSPDVFALPIVYTSRWITVTSHGFSSLLKSTALGCDVFHTDPSISGKCRFNRFTIVWSKS